MKSLPGYIDPFLSPVSGLLGREQPQPDLERGYIWMGDKNNRSIPSFKFIDLTIDVRLLQQQVEPVSFLPTGNLFIGNSKNIPTPQPTIALSNLPDLGTTTIVVSDPLSSLSPVTVSGGKIWQGTNSNRPEESTALLKLEGDIDLINTRFTLSKFIMRDALVKAAWPQSQFLTDLPDGMLKKTGDLLQQAVSGKDYVDATDINVGPLAIVDPLCSSAGNKFIAPVDFKIRLSIPPEFGEDVKKVLTGIAGKFTQFAVTSLTSSNLIKVGVDGELISAIPNTDYTTPSVVSGIMTILSGFQSAYNIYIAQATATNKEQDEKITTIDEKLPLFVKRPGAATLNYDPVIQHSLPVFLDTTGGQLASTEVTIDANRLKAEGLLVTSQNGDIVRGFEAPFMLNSLDSLPEIKWRLPRTPGLPGQLLCIEIETPIGGMYQLGWRYERDDERPAKNDPDGRYVRDPTGDWVWVVTTAAVAGGISWLGDRNSTKGEIPVYTADGGDTIKGSPATIDEDGNISTPGDITAESLTAGAITAVGTITASTLILSSTDAMVIPRGTSSERPSVPLEGMLRYNTAPTG